MQEHCGDVLWQTNLLYICSIWQKQGTLAHPWKIMSHLLNLEL